MYTLQPNGPFENDGKISHFTQIAFGPLPAGERTQQSHMYVWKRCEEIRSECGAQKRTCMCVCVFVLCMQRTERMVKEQKINACCVEKRDAKRTTERTKERR